MPPSGGGKRKRGDRTYSEEDGTRPSPHRPANLDLGRQYHSPMPARNGSYGRGRGDRRSSRGGRPPYDFHDVSEQTSPSASTPVPASRPSSHVPPLDPPSAAKEQSNVHSASKQYQYLTLTAAVRKDWSDQGAAAIHQEITTAVNQADDIHLLNVVQELIHASYVGIVPAEAAGRALQDWTGPASTKSGAQLVQSAVLDAVSIMFEDNSDIPMDPITEFLRATKIKEEVLRLELDQALLAKLGLISGRFKQMSIRKTTNILYRQANFNLMREESEGFAKLITELFTTSGSQPPTDEVIHQTVEKIKAMVGAFDLDVGRSLDVVLDVFGSVLVRHFRFLVKLLRASPWWPMSEHDGKIASLTNGLPTWAEPNGTSKHEAELASQDHEQSIRDRDAKFWDQARNIGLVAFQQIGRKLATPEAIEKASSDSADDFRSQWIRDTGTVAHSGNRDAAQLLGFKLRFYSASAARDANDVLPDNLIHLSALLIKIGFISMNDLYPHIWRSDEEMEELKQTKLKEKQEKERAGRPGAGSKNALAMAGALADDTLPAPVTRLKEAATRSSTPSRDTEAAKPVPKDAVLEPNDQKVVLLKSLLAIGALPEALFILGRFPWIIDLYPEIPEYLHRIIHHCLQEVYEKARPLRVRESLRLHCPLQDVDGSGPLKGQVRLTDVSQKKTLKWANLDRDDSGDGTDYRFYWDEWNDNIPICHTVEDVFTLTKTMLTLVGVKIGYDPSLILKFARIGKYSLAEDTSTSNRHRWLDLIKRVLLPSLSLTAANAGVVNELFELISQYSTTTRYIMYLEWSAGRTSRTADIKAAFDQAKAETKDVLKRISKTNVKPMARALAKIAYANPHIVITTALAQIEAYDSIAEVFVEGARYFTDLGYDVLTWALISSLSKAGRDRIQEGGIFASRWLSALSQFAGKIYKRYSMMKPGPILQYVADQLEHGNSTDLKMLEQVVSSMAGIATDTSFNDAQLLAMGGGPLLQSQTILQLLDRRNDSKLTSRRLLKALRDHGLTAKFLISMAQQQQSCVFEQSEIPLKAIGNTFDEITRVMNQYLDLLRSNLTLEEFQSVVPDIAELILDYEVPPEIAFTIARPIISRKILDSEKENVENPQIHPVKNPGEDIDVSEGGTSEAEDGEAIDIEEPRVTPTTPSDHEVNGSVELPAESQTASEEWHPVLRPLMDALQGHLSEDITNTVGVGFYVTFWQLSLYDIYVPSKAYEDEMSRQKKKITAIMTDRSNVSASGAKARALNVKQYQTIVDELLKENSRHLKSYAESRARLTREKDQWFANKQRQSEQINTAIMEFCFLPRTLCSPQDAFFCFKFLKFLHFNSTPNFRTLGFYDIIFKTNRLVSLFFMCTSNESDNLGRFLRELLQDLGRWHKDKTVYEREAYGSKKTLIGFAMKVEEGRPQVFLDFERFRRLLFKWHSNVHAALLKCLTSTEYMHVRNAISVLRSVSPVFPAVKFHGTELAKAVDKLKSSDREDLKVSSSALMAALIRREKEWVLPAVFSQGQEAPRQGGQHGISDSNKERIEGKAKQGSAERRETISTAVEIPKPRKVEPKPSVDERLRPSPRPSSRLPQAEASRESPRLPESLPPLAHRSATETTRPSRHLSKTFEQDRSQDQFRRLSPPPRHSAASNTSSRLESDSRNGYRDNQRASTRNQPVDTGRADGRLGYGRPGYQEFGPESGSESARHLRPHERITQISDRDDRGPRRDTEIRHSNEERRLLDRDLRLNRGENFDRDYPRTSSRDTRVADREHGRSHESDRRRVDLIDDRQPTTISHNRPPTQPVLSGINPDRAALIETPEQRPDMSIRGQAQEKPRTPRQPSPSGEDEYSQVGRLERQERQQRRPESSSRMSSASHLPPPRSIATSHSNRDSRSYPPVDMQHGRLEPESPQRAPRHERAVEKDVPSGPRQRGLPAPRGRGGPAPVVLTQPSERQAPTGPARHFRNGSVQESQNVSQPADAAGVHPDRMGQIAGSEPPRFPQRQQHAPPPSGPRNGPIPSAQLPPVAQPIPRGAPTGPQGDVGGRGRRHAIEALNTTLAQAQGPTMTAGRGRGMGRPGSGPITPQTPPSGPSTRSSFGPPDHVNPNGMPVQPRPPSTRRDSTKEFRHEDDGRLVRSSGDNKVEREFEGPRRNERRDEQAHEPRGPRTVHQGELPPRKHPREEGTHYGGYPRGGMRSASDNKRPRRGG